MAPRALAAVAFFGLPALGLDRASGSMCMSTDAKQGCAPPCRNPPADSNSTMCECDIGPNGQGGVAARWCLGGALYLAWYDGPEAECTANPSMYTTKVPASFSWGPDFEGEVCRVDPDDPTMSYKLTCDGVEDYEGFVKHKFNNTDCGDGNLVETTPDGADQAYCQCMSDGWEAPRSECSSCDPSEYTCSDDEGCQLARPDRPEDAPPTLSSLCTVGQGRPACQCTSGNYMTSLLCVGGMPFELSYLGSSYTACKAHPESYTLARTVPLNDGCTANGMNGASSGQTTCTGVADFQAPKQMLYSDDNCQDFMMEVPGAPLTKCRCVPDENTPIKSTCRDCGDQYECQTQGGCEMAELYDGQCVWNASGVAGKKCGCWSRNYQTNICFGGNVYDAQFADVEYEICANRDVTQIAWKMRRDPSSDPSLKCQQTVEQKGAQSTIRTCTGVADGELPQQRYYADDACQTEVTALRRTPARQTCVCIGQMPCEKGAKFEKYACDPAGGVVATEYDDSECKTRTSITRKYPSPTDGDLGLCIDFPPRVSNPNAEAQIRFTCTLGRLRGEYWSQGDDCVSQAAYTLESWNPCICVGELRYIDRLNREYKTVAGNIMLHVGDVNGALNDQQFVDYIGQAVAKAAGVPSEAVTDLQVSTVRRLSEEDRRLAAGNVKASYKVVLPNARAAAAQASLSKVTAAEINTILADKPSLSFTFNATIIGAVTSAPTSLNDSAATRDDPLPTSAPTTTPAPKPASGVAVAHAPALAAAMLVVVAAAA